MATITLTLTAEQHALLHRHLFPDDGCEAVALAFAVTGLVETGTG